MFLKKNVKKAKSIVEHIIYEFFGNGNLTHYEQFIAEDIQVQCPQSWQEIHLTNLQSRNVVKKIDEEHVNAFKIKKIGIDDLILGEDKLVARWSSEGIHKGDFFDVKATHRPFELSGQTT